MWEKDETWIWIYKGKTRFYSQFYLHFILFDMKLISITMKMTLYLLRKQLPTVQYTWESVKFPTTLESCDSQSQIFGYNLRSFILKWYSVTYTSNTTVFKVGTVLCNNVKRLTLRSRFINIDINYDHVPQTIFLKEGFRFCVMYKLNVQYKLEVPAFWLGIPLDFCIIIEAWDKSHFSLSRGLAEMCTKAYMCDHTFTPHFQDALFSYRFPQ
jgi:hypothetical protein